MSWRPACTTTSTSGSASTRASGAGSGGSSPSGSITSVRHAVGCVGVGHRHLGQAEQRLVAAFGHELRVDRDPLVGRGLLRQREVTRAATILRAMPPLSTAFAAAAALAAGQFGAPAPPAQPARTAAANETVIGHSAQGRPIRALRIGSPRARVKLLVVGSVHGNERAGEAVVARLRRLRPPRGTALWLIEEANPDGAAANTRHNANGVDLNRNFPFRWRPQDGVYESGGGPASEPETQVLQRFIERERPRVTLWYHQALTMVVKSTGDPVLERHYSRASGLPRRRLPAYYGTATSWQNTTFDGDSAFVVELPGRRADGHGSSPPRPRGARAGEGRGAAATRVQADPVPRAAQGRHARLRPAALRPRRAPPASTRR